MKKRILIFRNQGIGDLILVSPAVRAIRSLHPEAHIAMFVGDWSRVSVENNPNIDEIISYPDTYIQDKKPFKILGLVNRIRKGKFDRVYIFHSHDMLHLMVWLAGISERYGFSFNGSGRFLTDKTEWEPNSSRYIADNYLDIPRLAGFDGDDVGLDFNVSNDAESEAEKIIEENGIDREKLIILAPGGGINPRQDVFEKRWGTDKFAGLIDALSEEKLGGDYILTGAKAESDICCGIEKLTDAKVLDLCGKTSFEVSAALVKKSKLLVSNDSSIMHTAVAFGIPSMAIFGPSNPSSLLPVSEVNRWISSGVDCSPCYCNSIFEGCQFDLKCMTELTVDKVLNSIKDLWFDRYSEPQKVLSDNSGV